MIKLIYSALMVSLAFLSPSLSMPNMEEEDPKHSPHSSAMILESLNDNAPQNKERNLYSAHPDDPFKERLILTEKIKEDLKARFKLSSLPFDKTNPDIKGFGPFIVDKRLSIGYGDDAEIFLSIDQESKVLLCAKWFNTPCNLEENGDYISLRKLNRMYGCYSSNGSPVIFLPYAAGLSISNIPIIFKNQEFSKSLSLRTSLCKAFFAELSYLALRGVIQLDNSYMHFITDSNIAHILCIDFSSERWGEYADQVNKNPPFSESDYGFNRIHCGVINKLMTFSYDGEWEKYISTKPWYQGFRDYFNPSGMTVYSLEKAKKAYYAFIEG